MTVFQSANKNTTPFQEGISNYVTELQVHMSLQSKQLVCSLEPTNDSLHQLIHETQANLEKLASRQLA
ncbi:MAG: hypothetical protein HC799_14030 [Limnothrix sp. RL_2_0]|nr:hypothetical protein [Limnothrix sp. RL_2_0]